MESIKRKWGKPGLDVQVFMPNDFIAACAPDETYFEYRFWCDAGSSVPYSGQKVWLDKGTIGVYDENQDEYIGTYHACKKTHVVKIKKSEYPNPESQLAIIFPYGLLMDANDNWRIKPVRIWRGEYGNNIHCTYSLKENSWTEKNPS